MNRLLASVCLSLGTIFTATVTGADPATAFPKPTPNSADEPLAKSLSLPDAARFLDAASVNWTRDRKCATCHTNVPYLMARPLIKGARTEGMAEVRRFFEDRVAHLDDEAKAAKPRWDAEVVVTAAALALNDAQTTGKLHRLTRKALDRMWTVQRADGGFNWLKCAWPPFEHDDYFGAVLAALAARLAPDGYDVTLDATPGMARLQRYLERTKPPTLHHKTWLLWAAGNHWPAVMPQEERKRTIRDLLALQHEDGGWSLASLGDWKGHDGRENDARAPSDGYATGLVVYVLRQAGMEAKEEPIRRGVRWLKTNQRASGRWFTRSLNSDRAHYITNAGTAFAVLALTACGEK